MPAFTLDPNANGYLVQWTFAGGGTTHWDRLADAVDANYVYLTAGQARRVESCAMENLPGDAATISGNVTHNARMKANTGYSGDYRPGFYYSGVNNGAAQFFTENGTWQNIAFARAKPGGGSWTPAVVNATELYVDADPASVQIQMTKYYATGTYLQAGESFLTFYAWAALSLGGNILLSHMPRLAAVAWARKFERGIGRVTWLPSEYAEALRALRDYRHPRHFVIRDCLNPRSDRYDSVATCSERSGPRVGAISC